MYTINIGDFEYKGKIYTNRCLSASYSGAGVKSDVIPWEGTKHNPWDYKHENEQFIFDEIKMEDDK